MLHPIHLSESERAAHEQASSAAKMLKAMEEMNTKTQGNPELVKALDNNTRKLEEIKSAVLATNIISKQIKEKTPTSFKAEKVEFNGAEVVTLQGKTGPKGDRGEQGPPGRDGRDGKDGESIVGPPGKDAKDPEPLSPEEIVGLINKSKIKISPKLIQGLANMIDSYRQMVESPTLVAGGGNRDGTEIVNEDLSSGGTATGTSFTLSRTPITGSVKLHRGGARISTAASDYTISGSTITLTASLSVGEFLTADYRYR